MKALYLRTNPDDWVTIYNMDNLIYHANNVPAWVKDHIIERPDQEIHIRNSDGDIEVVPYKEYK